METAPVSFNAETNTGVKRESTQIVPKTDYIALTETNFVPLTRAQISLCAKMGYTYYCEYVQGLYFFLVVGTLLVVVFFRVVVVVVALQMHWGMLCEVLRDCTGSYILSQ